MAVDLKKSKARPGTTRNRSGNEDGELREQYVIEIYKASLFDFNCILFKILPIKTVPGPI